jgi:GNAT superfamily N-acetyltransferase
VDPTSAFPRMTGTAEVSVRPARPDDADAIARVQVVTWRTAYRDVLPREVLDQWDDEAAAASWRAAISTPPTPGHGVLVAVERDALVGFAAFAPAPASPGEPPDPAGPSAEIAVLLVEPRWGRRGHGSRLLAAVTDVTAATGITRLLTWVPESDQASTAFLESAGWAPDGWAQTLDTGGTPVRQLRWHTLLGEGEPGGAPVDAPEESGR